MKIIGKLALVATNILIILPLTSSVYAPNITESRNVYAEQRMEAIPVVSRGLFREEPVDVLEVNKEEDIMEEVSIINNYSISSDLTKPCGLSAEQLNKGLLYSLNGYAEDFLKAEEKYGVNAVALASIAALEGDWGRSYASTNKNNFFGWGPGIYFNSKVDGVMTVAESLSKNYLNQNGKWYNGATLSGVNTRYCESSEWKYKVSSIMNDMVGRALA